MIKVIIDNNQKVINRLQKICLPSDELCPIENEYWIILKDGNKYVGFAGISLDFSDAWYLCRAGIIPEYQGRGLQKLLINKRLELIQDSDIRTVVTDCTTENAASANSLISCGFRVYTPDVPWALPHSIYWIKRV